MEIPGTCLCIDYVSRHVQSFKAFGRNLLKLELFKDKSLVRISFLQHIHHENVTNFKTSGQVNKRLLKFFEKTMNVTTVLGEKIVLSNPSDKIPERERRISPSTFYGQLPDY